MERKIDQALATWHADPARKPLMLFGPRQTGKTTSLLELGKRFYQQTVHIDFYRQPHLKAAFQGNLEPREIIQTLEALLRVDIEPRTTLLFLDEIQDCDEAITALKFFCTDAPGYHIASAGSLLGVHLARRGSFPVGYVDMLHMHPMDFEEYCWATNDRRAFDMVRSALRDKTACTLHDHMMERYRNYLLVGGMPEVVRGAASGWNLPTIQRKQNEIRTAYVADMAKYATSTNAAKIVSTWESMPSQLAKESGSTKFTWKLVERGAKAERYSTAVDWLVASGIVSKCTQVSEGVSPLKSFENPSSFKLYLADTGLLACAYQAGPLDFEGKDAKTARFRGGMAENYVMQQLTAQDIAPYYWGRQSTHEVEFIITTPDGIVPIEVKSSTRIRSTSAKRFAEKYGCPYIIRVTGKNIGDEGGVMNVPLYAACLIGETCATN